MLWPCGCLAGSSARMGGGRLVSLCATLLLGDPASALQLGVTRTSLFCFLWFSWDMGKPTIFLCQTSCMSMTGSNGSSGRLFWSSCGNLACVLKSNQAQGIRDFGSTGLSGGVKPYVV